MTERLFENDSRLKSCTARVTGINARGGIILDRTVFYPTGGGQPGDSGTLTVSGDGDSTITIATTVKDGADIIHVPDDGQTLPEAGADVQAEINWERRHKHMRIHSCLHLISAILPYPVTGCQIGDGDGRIDLDIPEPILDKDALTQQLNELIENDNPVSDEWITDADMDANPDLVKTLTVKPPKGMGNVRLIRIADCDVQPCGGTHVSHIGEIGPVRITKIEKKGARNRRVRIALA